MVSILYNTVILFAKYAKIVALSPEQSSNLVPPIILPIFHYFAFTAISVILKDILWQTLIYLDIHIDKDDTKYEEYEEYEEET